MSFYMKRQFLFILLLHQCDQKRAKLNQRKVKERIQGISADCSLLQLSDRYLLIIYPISYNPYDMVHIMGVNTFMMANLHPLYVGRIVKLATKRSR